MVHAFQKVSEAVVKFSIRFEARPLKANFPSWDERYKNGRAGGMRTACWRRRRGKGRGQKRPNDGWSRAHEGGRLVEWWKRRKRITKWTTRSPPSVPGGRRTASKVMVSGVRAVSDAARVWQRARTYRALPS